jgi:hypothetical protein
MHEVGTTLSRPASSGQGEPRELKLNMSKITRLAQGALLIALSLGLAGSARALTLADLNAGASFSDGTLSFSDFSVTLPATVGSSPNALASVDLSLFEVEVLPASGFGFRVLEFDIPLVAAGDQVGQMLIDYRVTANPTTVITGAGLRFTGTAVGTGAITRIDQLVSTPAGDIELNVIRQAGGVQDPEDAKALPAPSQFAEVATNIRLDVSSRTAFIAQISELEGQFSVAPIPEPGAIMIFAASLGLVTTASRRRWL